MKLTINNTPAEAPEGATILEAARAAGVHIPTLCHMDMHGIVVNKTGTCRVCMVEVEGRRNLAPACSTPAAPGMVIHTATPRAINSRRRMVELLLSNHPKECLICARNRNCELQSIAAELGIREITNEGEVTKHPKDETSHSLVRNMDKCILCRRCETMCNDVQTVGVYSCVNRGFETVMGTAFDLPMTDTVCTFCGQCVSVCPTAALSEKDDTKAVWEVLSDPDKLVIAQTAPAVRVAIGEEFGLEPGTRCTGKMTAALRRLGFDKVMDTNYAADMTILEEASELIHRIKHNGRLPILTSCCPAWVKFIEHHFPDLLDIPSSCKSPHEMFGAVAKSYLAKKLGVDPAKIVIVSVMPCIAKKYEASRPELGDEGVRDVDYVISTREFARMIREAGINFLNLPDEDFDPLMGESTGAGMIFGTTGGVIEAALRTAYVWITGENPPDVNFTQLRGMDGVREATVKIGDMDMNIAVANGLGHARELLEMVRKEPDRFQAIEIMACPGGCVGGGGQPYHHNDIEILRKRAMAVYEEDAGKKLRMSHENPEVLRAYEEFIGEPYGEMAHKLLHTEYVRRELL